jgi:predicted DNA-binding protein (UPF0278 family)
MSVLLQKRYDKKAKDDLKAVQKMMKEFRQKARETVKVGPLHSEELSPR